jgi:hypothetical protein
MNTLSPASRPIMIARSRVQELFPGLHPKTLANLNSKNEGPPGFKTEQGRLIFYRVEDIEKYLESNPVGGREIKW